MGATRSRNQRQTNGHSNMLIPEVSWKRISQVSPLNAQVVEEFAQEQGITPGIVVGRLQREGILDLSHLNYLRACLDRDS